MSALVEDFVWTMAKDLQAFEEFPWGTFVYSKSLHYPQMATSEGKLTGEVGKKVNIYDSVWIIQVQSVIYYSLCIALHYIIIYDLSILTIFSTLFVSCFLL